MQIGLCDKSRMTGDCHVRFRERLGVTPAYSARWTSSSEMPGCRRGLCHANGRERTRYMEAESQPSGDSCAIECFL